jgi:dienelactone hydrolase
MNTTNIHYKDGEQELEGYVAYDPAIQGRRPAVLIAHAWGGLLDFERGKADALARLGYVGFAMDLYGTGNRGGSVEENSRLMQPFLADRGLVRRRMQAGLEAARSHELVDPGRVAVIGYCFGGLCVLDLARSGADVAGVVSFHGLLSPPDLRDNPETVTAKVLVLHGHDDPMVPPAQVAGLTEELTRAKADWQIHVYGHTLHAFTNPEMNDPTGLGAAYDATADRRSWVAMENFLAELFGE